MRRFVFAGSFDPFTIGHANLVQRGLDICDELLLGIGYNEHKPGWIPVEERVRALQKFYAQECRVKVKAYTCLTVDFAKEENADAILRGVRNMSDFEYEMQMADINRRLTGIETILLPAEPQLACVSSSMVRELLHFGKDITSYLPTGLYYIV